MESALYGQENKFQPSGQAGDNCLRIYTLGHFHVKLDNFDFSEKARRSTKLWELFKYLITNRNKQIPVETIIESLWPEQEYNNQVSALHTLTHRMRKLFNEEFSPGMNPFRLDISQGCFCLKLMNDCWIDADEFAKLSQQAAELSSTDPGAAIETYRKALSLYQGDYFIEYSSRKWLLPARRHYRHLYLQNLLEKLKLLMAFERYSDIFNACEKAFQIEHFMEVEALHLYYIEALLKSGNKKQALCHYEFLTSTLYQDYGTKPSSSLKDLYKQMQPDAEAAGLNLNAIHEKLIERDKQDGAFICDLDFFRFLYRLEIRRNERSSQELILELFTLNCDENPAYKKDTLNKAMSALEKILLANLRKGDTITRFSESQFLALLPNVSQVQSKKIYNRINSSFNNVYKNKGITLEFSKKTAFLDTGTLSGLHARVKT